MKKILKWTAIVLGGLIGLALLTGLVLYPSGKEKLSRSYPNIPVEKVNIPNDSAAVSDGRHIAIIWGCTKCHGEALSGMLLTDDPLLGTIPATNLTSGNGGIGGSYADVDWIRAIRHGVKPDGRVEIFMNDYSTMSDQNLGDLIAYLKQIPQVNTNYPAMQYGPIVPLAPVVGIYTPAAELMDHSATRSADPAPGATLGYGKYLFAICTECHSATLAGKLENWRQEDFVRALRTGVLPNGKPINPAMSSKTFSEMNDTELIALWLYLQSLPPLNSRK